MKKIIIGGVPEHFNYPWQYGIKNNHFTNHNIDLQWIDYPTGTGAMCNDLAEKKLDLALLLTEGAVADYERNHNFEFVQWYVKTPLIWGIHTSANNQNIHSEIDITNKKYAISRKGSGSHLMAYVNAQKQNISIQDSDFVIVNNIQGAVESINNSETDLFLWEKFTTQPYVDKRNFKRIGECPTPWPCFILVARKDIWENDFETISKICHIINSITKNIKDQKDLIKSIAELYTLNTNSVSEWIQNVEWHSEMNYDKKILNDVKAKLIELGILN